MKHLGRTIVGSLLAACVAGSTLAGCSSKAAKTVGTSSADLKSIGFQTSGEQIVSKPFTLNVLTTRWGNMGDTFTQNTWLKDLEKSTNVTVKWQVQSLNDWSDKKSIMLASGTLPDVILGDQTFTDSDIINNQNSFRALDTYVDKYMPNYKAAIKETPALKKICTFPDGNMYSLGKTLPCRPETCNQPIINKTWLDKLGLQVPTTIDELEQVLIAFKTKDPNGNGKADEIPITGSKDLSMDLLNPFGITDENSNAPHLLVNNGKLSYYPVTDQYKAGIEWLRKLYQEGLIDTEAFTQDDTMATAKYNDPNAARVGLVYAWTPDSLFSKWKDQYVAIAPIAGPDGKRYAGGDSAGVFSLGRNELEITASCKYPEVAARWADNFYTGEASIQNDWGAIGTVISKNSDGTYTLNDPPAGTSADAWYWDQSLRDFGPKYVSADFEKKIKLPATSGDGLKQSLSKLGDQYVTTPYPSVMYTKEESAQLPTLTTDIESYIKTSRATWITKGGVDQDWDAYVKKLNDMGLQKLMKIYTDAYTRYQKTK